MAGRGFGKTHTGAKSTLAYALTNEETISAVVAPTSGDLRRVCFGGPSGILSMVPKECLWKGDLRKSYNGTSTELTLYNGSKIQGYVAIEPERMRGPQYHFAWADELAAWRYEEAWDQLNFGLRLGDSPRVIVTTTPKPTKIMRNLVRRGDDDVRITTGSTFENEENLAPTFLDALKERYEGTRMGRQEMYAELLEDVEGALWNRAMLDDLRQRDHPELKRIVVGVDPSVTGDEDSDECGMIIGALGTDDHAYILADVSDIMSVGETSKRAVRQYHSFSADRIVAEVNNGGDWIEHGIRQVDNSVAYKKLHASKGKYARAEPVAALYEQGKVHHVGTFPKLEDELCSWEPDSKMRSPNRLDALVWVITELMLSGNGVSILYVEA